MSVQMGVNDVAKFLDMSPSTVKKYYLAVEKQGYRFRRNQSGHVMFGENDVNLFKMIIVLKNQPGMTVEQAVEKATSAITDMTIYSPPEEPESSTPAADMTVMMDEIKELKEMLKLQNELYGKVVSELAEIKAEQKSSRMLIESSEKEKPDYIQAMNKTDQMFKEILDQLAASNEKKGFWSKLFK